MTDIREDRVSLLRNLEHPDTQGRFWERVAADVDGRASNVSAAS
jgi:hypothetical protein